MRPRVVVSLELMNDLRFTFRQLLKNHGLTPVAVLTLAVGIEAVVTCGQ